MFETRIKEKIEVEDFKNLIKKYQKEQIECTTHTFFRLSTTQRNFYTCEELTRILLKDTPFLVGTQFNGNYAVFYHYKNKENEKKTLKMIISVDIRKVNIVTFYFIEEWQIPQI